MAPTGDDIEALLEESLEDLYEDAPVGHVSTLVGGTIVKANRTLEQWTGYDRSTLIGGLRLQDILAPGARVYYETHVAPLLQMQGEVREIALELIGAGGTRLPVLMSSTLVRDGRDRPQVVRTTFLDASERRRYERELLRARTEAEMRARSSVALGHVTEGVVLVDDSGRIEVMNPAAERIFAVTRAAAVGLPAEEVIESWAEVSAVLPARGANPEAQVLPVQRGGDEQWLAVAAVDAGDGVVYTVRDVTHERKLEQLRADLVATVSHELRTPLTGVVGAATTLLARDDGLAPDARRTLLAILVEQAERLSEIVEQILFAGDIGEVETELVVVDEVIAGVEAHRVLLEADGEIRVRADANRLLQVLRALVDNALKYTAGPVRVHVEAREFSTRITVSDEGPGIPAAERERIFEKFYRLDPAQHSGVGGIGLGLYIARELVERMGGRIGLLGSEPGATFYVDLPNG